MDKVNVVLPVRNSCLWLVLSRYVFQKQIVYFRYWNPQQST